MKKTKFVKIIAET